MSMGESLSDYELAKLLQDQFDREVPQGNQNQTSATNVDHDYLLAKQLQEQHDKGSSEVDEHDYKLAQQLQSEFDSEVSAAGSKSNSEAVVGSNDLPSTSNYDGEDAELLDPTPDICALFLQYNKEYFWNTLSCIEVKWSSRMTLCAGICYYKPQEHYCSVRLSAPLLKLRPRSDMVNTLLHEMIHAYLFVTKNNRDHDDHGPEFHKHMNRINDAAGVNISVYHTFHDEVDHYRQHKWLCDGPCRHQPPYYGLVCRAMNRPPSSRDPWFAQHQATCGGSYSKIQEPEGYGEKKKGKKTSRPAAAGNSSKPPVGNGKIDGFLQNNTPKAPDTSIRKDGKSVGSVSEKDNDQKRGIPSHSRLLDTNSATSSSGVLTSSQSNISGNSRSDISNPQETGKPSDEMAYKRKKKSVNNVKFAKKLSDIFSSSDSD